MPLLLLIFMVQNVARFSRARQILLGWCWDLRSEEFVGIWRHLLLPCSFFQWAVVDCALPGMWQTHSIYVFLL